VAARGIDVDNLTHVFHHTLPDQLDGYTHRSGRNARAGKKGISLAFINPREGRKITDLERKNQIKFQAVEVPSIEDLTSSRMHNWANLIANTKVDSQADAILEDVQIKFAGLSKEDLLKRLITSQLDHILARNKGESNLNEHNERKERQGGQKGKSNGDIENGALHRYFVNVGAIDGVTRGDLVHFLSDVSNVERQYFSQVSLQKNYSFFYLDAKQDKGFADHFKGLEVEGHMIRVNRDDQEHKPVKKRHKKKERRNSYKSSGRRGR
jgi:ATP-dependent RNA helicase DeaD